MTTGLIAIAVGITMSVSVLGAALAQGMVATKALEAMARQPEMAGSLRSTMILALGIIEALAIYALLISFMLLGKM